MDGGPAAMVSRETLGATSSQLSTTSSGPKQSSHTCTGLLGYSSPHSRHRNPSTLPIPLPPAGLTARPTSACILLYAKPRKPLVPGTGREAEAFVVPPVFAAPSRTRPQRVRQRSICVRQRRLTP